MQDKLTSAMDRLNLGQNYRQKTREEAWRMSHEMYMGEGRWSYAPDDPTADVVNINIAFSTINTLVPFVADENPKFLITPESGDSNPDSAALLQAYVNRMWRSKDVQGQIYVSESTFDYLLLGDGYMKAGYEIISQPAYDSRGKDVSNDRIKVAKFSVSRPSPWDVWVDPYSDGLHNARWVCQRIILPVDELKRDDRYTLTNDLESGQVDSEGQASEDRSRLEDITGYTTIYEFYDLREKWMLTFLEGGQRAIRFIEHVVCPLVQLHNYRIPNSPYHMGELEMVKWLQDELNKTRSQMITHRRRNVVKWLYRENALNEEAVQALKSGKVNDAAPVSGNEPFDFLVTQIAPVPLTADSYQIEAQIRADINEITGVNEYLRGMPQGNSRTATEATILEGATNIRTRHKLVQIETAARQVGQLMLDIIQDVLPLTDFEEMSIFVTGREADKLNRQMGETPGLTDLKFTPTPEIFEGRYNVEVERGSTELRNPQIKYQKLSEMVGTMLSAAPLLMQMGILFNVQPLLELWFEAGGIEDVDALFEPSEEQQIMAQMQQAQMLQGIMGGGEAAPPGAEVTGGATQPGQPRPQTAQPPMALPTEDNSGMLPPTY
jgi:hypothetical protein